jgi:hypothetical protein
MNPTRPSALLMSAFILVATFIVGAVATPIVQLAALTAA